MPRGRTCAVCGRPSKRTNCADCRAIRELLSRIHGDEPAQAVAFEDRRYQERLNAIRALSRHFPERSQRRLSTVRDYGGRQ